MLKPRLIPNLLISEGGLVKTKNYKSPKYIGDPINAVRIFNEKEVDELMITDIDATIKKTNPNLSLIKSIAKECRMPLSYSGGIKNVNDVEKIIELGVEKVGISSAIFQNPFLIKEASEKVGSQSIIAIFDVKKVGILKNKYGVFINNGKINTGYNLLEAIHSAEKMGAGEILLNSIDKDGTMLGYDMELAKEFFPKINIPLTLLGGAGKLEDIKGLFDEFKIIGAGAGSFFIFKGKYRAVLIQYPNSEEKSSLYSFQNY